nr:transposase [Collinsella sp. OM06-18AC]
MYHVACDMLEGCRPRTEAILEEAELDALAYLDFPPSHWKRLRTNNVQERTNREIKRRSRVVQALPSTAWLVRLAGAVMYEQDKMRQEPRYFLEAKMGELYDEGRTRGIDGTVDWAQLEAEARKIIESGLELATGSRRHRISTVFQVPGRRADLLRIGLYTNFLDTTT